MTIRIVFGVSLILASLLVYVPSFDARLRRRDWQVALIWAFVATRVAGWWVAYVGPGGLARYTDLIKYYYPEALLAWQGQVPYRDFPSSYGPLFPYLSGALLPVWPTPAAVGLVMIACECAALALFVRLARKTGSRPEDTGRAVFVYAVNPAAMYWSGMMAYNSSVVLLFWVIATGLLVSGRRLGSGLAIGCGVMTGKALGVLLAPVWLAHAKRSIGTLAGATATAGAIVIGAHFSGVDLLMPLLREGSRSTSGNVWFLLSAVVPLSPEHPVWRLGPAALFVLGAGSLTFLLYRRWIEPPSLIQVAAAASAIGWLFLIVSKKSYPHYLPMFLLFSVFAVARNDRRSRRHILLLSLVGAIGVIEPGLWNALGQPPTLDTGSLPPGLMLLDIVLVALAVYFFIVSTRVALAAGPTRLRVPRPVAVPSAS